MFILEEPFVSDYLVSAVRESGAPVLRTPKAVAALGADDPQLLDDADFEAAVRSAPRARLYSNSENAVAWVTAHLGDTDAGRAVAIFKDKFAYREAMRGLHPDFGFAGLSADELADFDPAGLKFPLVVKPSVGFFSLGVHLVDSPDAWPIIAERIAAEASAASAYPGSVVGRDRFIVEETIEGEEFAVDAYFDSNGTVVVLNVMAHLFAGPDDVSDRVYYTSAGIVERWREHLGAYLQRVGDRLGIRDFPVHAELRVAEDGSVNAIEINPMRFGGWCVGDMAHYAWGFDPYAAFLADSRPDWPALFGARGDVATAVVVADIPRTISAGEHVDYDAFLAEFSRPLDVRRTDAATYTVFAFLFAEVPANDLSELEAMLGRDMTRYVRS